MPDEATPSARPATSEAACSKIDFIELGVSFAYIPQLLHPLARAASNMSAPNDKRDSSPADVLEPPFDLALRLGLKPYAEFEEKMSPLFARINPSERQRFLRDIYRLAAEKVLRETARNDVENLARQLMSEAEELLSATSNIKDASQSLLKAADVLPEKNLGRLAVEGVVSQLHAIMQRLVDKAEDLARFVDILRNLEGKEITITSSASYLQYAVELRKMSEVAPELPFGEQLIESY